MKRPKDPVTTLGPDRMSTKITVDPSLRKGKLYVDRTVMADGRRLKEIRKEQGLSVRELSEESGVSTSVIYRLEKGRIRECWVQMYNLSERIRTSSLLLLCLPSSCILIKWLFPSRRCTPTY